MLNISRQSVSTHIEKWLPLWATFGSYISMLPMTHDNCNKELCDEYQVKNMFNITYLLERKDIITETKKK